MMWLVLKQLFQLWESPSFKTKRIHDVESLKIAYNTMFLNVSSAVVDL